MPTLTREQKQLIDEAGEAPVRIADPDTGESYVLIRTAVFDRMRALIESEEVDPSCFEIDDFEPAREDPR